MAKAPWLVPYIGRVYTTITRTRTHQVSPRSPRGMAWLRLMLLAACVAPILPRATMVPIPIDDDLSIYIPCTDVSGTTETGGATVTAVETGQSTLSDSTGNYKLNCLPVGTSTIKATKSGTSFIPSGGRLVSVPTATDTVIPNINFNYGRALSGNVGVANARIDIVEAGVTVFSDADGNYLAYVGPGTFTVRVSKTGVTFSPSSRVVSVGAANLTNISFGVTAATVPGLTPGEFKVSEMGSASYTIPIQVPPGTAGMVPSLALTYDSRRGSSMFGVGWSLSGLSIIERCAATIAQDGYKQGVKLDYNDRFCLDGEHLIKVAGTTYGGDGTEYRTEREGWLKIVSYGTAGNGPARFRVWSKSGQIMDYGATADSAIEAKGKTTIRSWAVNKIADRKGNYLTATYVDDQVNGQFYPTRIDYSGNVNASGVQVVSPYNYVEFVPATRPDQVARYISDSLVRNTVRISNIRTYAEGALVRDYRIQYDQGPETTNSRITSLTECDATFNCLPPTTFGWHNGGGGMLAGQQPVAISDSSQWKNKYRIVVGDFNGDGFSDVYQIGTSGSRFCAGPGVTTANNCVSTLTGDWKTDYQTIPVDLNRDGYADLLFIGKNGSYFCQGPTIASASNCTAITGALTGISGWIEYQVLPGDYNADGHMDLYLVGRDNGYFCPGPGIATTNNCGPNTGVTYRSVSTGLLPKWYIAPGDFNGDGISDLLKHEYIYGVGVPTKVQTYLCLGPQVASTNNCAPVGGQVDGAALAMQGDFNSDGQTDVMWNIGSSRSFCPGNQPAPQGASCNTFSASLPKVEGDFNGDGNSDLLQVRSDGVYLCRGPSIYAGNSCQLAFSGQWLIAQNGVASYPNDHIAGDFNGDGQTDLLIVNDITPSYFVPGGTHKPDLLTSARNGLGDLTSVSYLPATNSALQIPNTNPQGSASRGMFKNMAVFLKAAAAGDGGAQIVGASVPSDWINMRAPLWVVSSNSRGTGIVEVGTSAIGSYQTTYQYDGAAVDLTGRGFLGFRTIKARDPQTGLDTNTTYFQTYPRTNMVEKSEMVVAASAQKLAETTNTYSEVNLGGTRRFVYLSQSVESRWDLNSTVFPTVTKTVDPPDTYGNFTRIVVSHSDGYAKTTTNTYDPPDLINWILDRLKRATVTATAPSPAPTRTRTSEFTYEAGTGLLKKEILEPDTPALRLETEYGYDNFGNKTTVTVRGVDILTRTTTTGYDPKGRFPTSTTNALGHVEGRAYDARFGGITGQCGPNSAQIGCTGWAYDGLGRKKIETRIDGTKTFWFYEFWGGAGHANTYYIQETATGTPTKLSHYDTLNRVVVNATYGFKGELIYQTKAFNARGLVQRESRPYFTATEAPVYTEYEIYDTLGRPTRVKAFDGGITGMGYNGLAVATTNAKLQNSSQVKDSQGQVVRAQDHDGNSVVSKYDGFGNLLETTAAGVTTTMTYDTRGRKKTMSDPSMGAWSYDYNTLGELVKQTDAKSQVSTMEYDLLGRLKKRTQPDLVSDWTYDTKTYGKGKVAGVTASGTATLTGYNKDFTYDLKGRISQVSSTIDGVVYVESTEYENTAGSADLGKAKKFTYPAGAGGGRFAVNYLYTSQGYLTHVTNAVNGATLYQVNDKDARDQVLSESAGNGVVTSYTYDVMSRPQDITAGVNGSGTAVQNMYFHYDLLGNLDNRLDRNQSLDERFQYDTLNRLKQVSGTNASGILPLKTATYFANGNIQRKSDFGTGDYVYNPAKPHQVQSIPGIAGTFLYDLNGNMTSGDGRTLTWTSFNKPLSIVRGTSSVSFAYGAEQDEIRQIAPGVTTYYVGAYEKKVKAAVTEFHHYIAVGKRRIALHITSSSAAPATRYFQQDHLGSIVAVTNETGVVVERMSFDAWGKRRNANGTDAAAVTVTTTKYGFTGHEQLDDVGLVHMNARVYHPGMGRFVSADVYVQFPENVQSYNRYSYVLNNPLSFTDPSGNFAHLLPALIASFIVEAGITAITTSAFLGAVTGGFVFGYVASGGNVNAAWQTAFTAGVFHGIGLKFGDISPKEAFTAIHYKKVFWHGVAGGATAKAFGGSFEEGFLGAAFGQLVGPAIPTQSTGGQFVVRMIAGGIGAELGGGKFENGAATAAFAYLMNDRRSNKKGSKGEAETEKDLWAQGKLVLGRHIYVRTIAGPLSLDHYFFDPEDGRFYLGETKNGPHADYTEPQYRALDLVELGQWTPYGENAKQAGLTVGVPRGGIPLEQWGGVARFHYHEPRAERSWMNRLLDWLQGEEY